MIAVRASNGKGMRGREKKKEKKETLGDKAWLRIFHRRHHFFFLKTCRDREGGKDGSLETSIHPGGKNIRFPEKEEKKKKKKKEDEKTLPHDRPT